MDFRLSSPDPFYGGWNCLVSKKESFRTIKIRARKKLGGDFH
jgi:hypothetical protein